ncbi:MAG TPA: ATP-binding cassette domain-containing protein, partial [Casimicrobiaceae bacterium]|nr:ATP-binding cassette domain-containing protein [Casimicrobiaceae bacterium]
MLLEITGFSKRFGGVVAVSNVDLALRAGEIRGVIGPNGSGKTTLFNLISGVYKPEAGGTMFFDGENVTNLQPHEIARRGVARTFQMLRIFSQMTVLENLLSGHHCHTRYGTAA